MRQADEAAAGGQLTSAETTQSDGTAGATPTVGGSGPTTPTSHRAGRGAARSVVVRLLGSKTSSSRIWLITAVLVAITAELALLTAGSLSARLPPDPAVTLVLLLAFYATEAYVTQLRFGQSAHAFSLTEFPLVAGLIVVAPIGLLIARLCGSALALSINRRQGPALLAFNLAQVGLRTVSSIAIVALLVAPLENLGLSAYGAVWVAVIAAVVVENVISVDATSSVDTSWDATAESRRTPGTMLIGPAVSLTNTSVALMCLAAVFANPEAILLFIVPVLTIFAAYRAYVSERRQQRNIAMLYESTRILQRVPELETTLTSILGHVRTMFRADVAEICLLPTTEGEPVLRSRVGPGDAVEVMEAIGPALTDPALLRAVAERRTHLVADTAPTGEGGSRWRPGPKAIAAPLLGETDLIGTMMVADRHGDIGPFDLADLRLFETLASHAAIALENWQLGRSLEQMDRLKDELNHQASHDALTGLANRAVFLQAVTERLESTDQEGRIPVVLFLDLDDFKLVNDSLGHAAGDTLLVAVGDRIGSAIRSSDLAARFGGDEFAILLWDEPDLAQTMRIANQLTAALLVDFNLGGHQVSVRASVGVAFGRPGVDVAADLMQNADVAMYSAKGQGKSRAVVFEPSMREAIVTRAALLGDLERAIVAREFFLLYQPIVELATGRLAGVEALVRWQHPARGLLRPDAFIHYAEETGMIVDIGRRVLAEACGQLVTWSDGSSLPGFTVSVNVSTRELSQPDFVDETLSIIRKAGVDPAQVKLEVTETVMMHDWEETRSKLQLLRDAGAGISVDDFGTGFSSLSYLQRKTSVRNYDD